EDGDELVAAATSLLLAGGCQVEPGRGHCVRQPIQVGPKTSGAGDRGWHSLNCGRSRRLPIPEGWPAVQPASRITVRRSRDSCVTSWELRPSTIEDSTALQRGRTSSIICSP